MEIEKAINTVKDEELQMILTYRYIDCLTWDGICWEVVLLTCIGKKKT